MKFIINTLFAGAIYGIAWLLIKAVKHRKKVWKKTLLLFKEKKYSRMRLISGIFSVILLAALYFLPSFLEPQTKIALSIMVVAVYSMTYLIPLVKAVEEIAMIRLVEPEKLTEGDWIVNEIKIGGKYITGPKDLGIEKKKIRELIRLKKLGKIKKVKVKYGIPFVPSFLMGLSYTMWTDSIILLQLIL